MFVLSDWIFSNVDSKISKSSNKSLQSDLLSINSFFNLKNSEVLESQEKVVSLPEENDNIPDCVVI